MGRAAPILLALVLLFLAAPAADDREDQLERGRLLFRIYCENCHGAQGRGDGPTARVLTVEPADLTTLTEDGKFPREEVRATIDGRRAMTGHGDVSREMPIWGLGFQELDRDVDQEAQVAAKLDSLILFLESIQQEQD